MATVLPVNRERFERLLLRRLDQHRVGTAREAKRLIGGAWQTIINDMYKKNAARFSAVKASPSSFATPSGCGFTRRPS
jgi:hypothetical protein